MDSDGPNVPMTMGFVVMSLGTVGSGLVLRPDPTSGLAAPVLGALKVLSVPVLLTIAAVEIPFLQNAVGTAPLTGWQWLACIGLALPLPVLVESDKLIRRTRHAS